MTAEEYKHHINGIMERYEYLNLTSQQAGEIYEFELDKDYFSPKTYFTEWEEWDYESFAFRKILTDPQFIAHQEKLFEIRMKHEQWLIEHDGQNKISIASNQEILDYYVNVFLIGLFEKSLSFAMPGMHLLKEKITFLKSEYKVFLKESKKAMLAANFHATRSFTPNHVEAALIAHKVSYIWPAYSSFKHAADEGTKAVISYVSTNIRELPGEIEHLLTKKITELRAFNKKNNNKYYGDVHGLVFHMGQQSIEEEKEERVMQFLLLDADNYGLKFNKS